MGSAVRGLASRPRSPAWRRKYQVSRVRAGEPSHRRSEGRGRIDIASNQPGAGLSMPEIACGRQCRVLPLAKIEKRRTKRGVEWRLGHRDQFMVLIRSTGRPQKHQHYAGRAARLWPIASRLHGRPPAIRLDRVAGCRVTVPGTLAPPSQWPATAKPLVAPVSTL